MESWLEVVVCCTVFLSVFVWLAHSASIGTINSIFLELLQSTCACFSDCQYTCREKKRENLVMIRTADFEMDLTITNHKLHSLVFTTRMCEMLN